MRVKPLVAFLIVLTASLKLHGYDLDAKEEMAMEYCYGYQLTMTILQDVVIDNDITGNRMGEYLLNDGKIHINSARVPEFRLDLEIVHESVHWIQDKIIHRTRGWGLAQSASAYRVYIEDMESGRLGIESEAEMMRQLAFWYVSSQVNMGWAIGPACYVYRNDLIPAQDNAENRAHLWQYASKWLMLWIPENWREGTTS